MRKRLHSRAVNQSKRTVLLHLCRQSSGYAWIAVDSRSSSDILSTVVVVIRLYTLLTVSHRQ